MKVISITFLAIGFTAILYCIYMIFKLSLEIRNINLSIKRNEDVYNFRRRMIDEDFETFLEMPSYDEMMEDGKELKIESYIDLPKDILK